MQFVAVSETWGLAFKSEKIVKGSKVRKQIYKMSKKRTQKEREREKEPDKNEDRSIFIHINLVSIHPSMGIS